jgi:hypothetical protein
LFRPPKELKNHFHTCIIKSVRKIINNKFDCELKEIMRYFYAFDYLINMINKYNNNENLYLNESKKKRKKYKFNPKQLIKNNQLSIEKISLYRNKLVNHILLNKTGIRDFLKYINYINNFDIYDVSWLFSVIVKSKIINKCKKVLELGLITNKDIIMKVQNFLEDNSTDIYFDEVFFSKS